MQALFLQPSDSLWASQADKTTMKQQRVSEIIQQSQSYNDVQETERVLVIVRLNCPRHSWRLKFR